MKDKRIFKMVQGFGMGVCLLMITYLIECVLFESEAKIIEEMYNMVCNKVLLFEQIVLSGILGIITYNMIAGFGEKKLLSIKESLKYMIFKFILPLVGCEVILSLDNIFPEITSILLTTIWVLAFVILIIVASIENYINVKKINKKLEENKNN